MRKKIKKKLLWLAYKVYVNGLISHQTYADIHQKIWWW